LQPGDTTLTIDFGGLHGVPCCIGLSHLRDSAHVQTRTPLYVRRPVSGLYNEAAVKWLQHPATAHAAPYVDSVTSRPFDNPPVRQL
jgi:hypothetical protein